MMSIVFNGKWEKHKKYRHRKDLNKYAMKEWHLENIWATVSRVLEIAFLPNGLPSYL